MFCECGKHEIYVKKLCLCRSCYERKRYKDNPEMYELRKKANVKYIKEHPEKRREYKLKWQRKNPEKVKQANKRYLDKHPEKKAVMIENLRKAVICNILKKHAIDLKDDPERLSTEFLQNLIGIECKKSNIKGKL